MASLPRGEEAGGAEADVFLEVAEEELVVVDVVGALGEAGDDGRVVGRGDVGDFHHAPVRVEPCSAEGGNLALDGAGVVGKAGAEVPVAPGGDGVGAPVEGIDAESLGPGRDDEGGVHVAG